MSLREEMWKYEQITGESAEHVPIIKIVAFLDGYEMGLKALEQQPRWIPVSERLPEEIGGDYLVTIEYKGEIEGVDVATYGLGGYIDGLWDTVNDWIEGPSELWYVTAWMPLPEPYKEAKDE